MLAPTPRDRLVDQQGRPYFLWDAEMTLEEFERVVSDPQAATRPYLIGKVLRQAKPDDALQFVSPQEIADLWPSIERYLGKSRPFWSWLLDEWESRGFEPPARHRFGEGEILVDSARAILAEKLYALLERSEPRDLIEIEALLRAGEKLDVALADAPRHDRGFSSLTLA